MECETWNCKKRAVFKTTRDGKPREKVWCEQCFAKKAGKYELTVIKRV